MSDRVLYTPLDMLAITINNVRLVQVYLSEAMRPEEEPKSTYGL